MSKEAKPSEAFECLKQIEDVIETKIGLGVVNTYLIDIIKKTLIKAKEDGEENEKLWNDITAVSKQYTDLMLDYQEQKRVLEIINKKNVDIIYLKDSNNVEEYNSHFGAVVCKLTPEEYDAVKKWLG